MLVTPQFVFLHVPKTGGAFLKAICEQHFDVVPTDGLKGIRQIPEPFRDLPKFGLVRNPWDWYVSFYEFARQNPPWGEGLTDGSFENFLAAPMGLAARGRCLYMATLIGTFGRLRDSEVSVGKTETLAEGFLAFLDEYEIEQPSGLRTDLLGPRVNRSKRSDYRDYYNAETQAHVAKSCRLVTQRFGYRY